MSETGLTTMNVKKINKNKVYSYIYKEKVTSKMQIVQQLQMGLSTVSQNLKLLEDEGLIEREGFFESTGGRKANAIQIVRTARVAVGIGILKDKILIAVIDLYGDAVCRTEIAADYVQEDAYYKKLGKCLEDFIAGSRISPDAILGVSIATQGVISTDGKSVSYGAIMHNSDMKLSDFEKYIPYPCRLVHDSKAAACLELWKHTDLQNALFILLNPNLGGAIISDGTVQQGAHMRSGLLEHLCITQDGPLCYCGKRGCLETTAPPPHWKQPRRKKSPNFSWKSANQTPRCGTFGTTT